MKLLKPGCGNCHQMHVNTQRHRGNMAAAGMQMQFMLTAILALVLRVLQHQQMVLHFHITRFGFLIAVIMHLRRGRTELRPQQHQQQQAIE